MNENLECRVSDLLVKLGCSPALLGFAYLKEAICICFDDPDSWKGCVTKRLYPTVASIYSITTSCVERRMRFCIEQMFDRYSVIKDNFFGGTVCSEKGKPTNSEFIFMVIERMKMGYEV